MQNYYEALVNSTRAYVLQSGLSGAIVGISGGIDSALTLSIAVSALGRHKVRAVFMPSRYTSEESIRAAFELAGNLGVDYSVFSIDDVLALLMGLLELSAKPGSVVEQNMQARIRGLMLMSMSNELDYIVLATGNRSELLTGYSTLYGDTCGGYAPLKYVYKTEVYQLANWCNSNGRTLLDSLSDDSGSPLPTGLIPDFIITREPTAELKFNQLDVHSLPPYHILDNILKRMIDLNIAETDVAAGASCDLQIVVKVKHLVNKYAYKRLQYPEGPNFKGYKDC